MSSVSVADVWYYKIVFPCLKSVYFFVFAFFSKKQLTNWIKSNIMIAISILSYKDMEEKSTKWILSQRVPGC